VVVKASAVGERTRGWPWVSTVADFAHDTVWLGLRTLRRFYRVPAWTIGIVIFPLIQLFVFGQLFRQVVQLPEFSGTQSYMAYLAPGQLIFAVFFAVTWSSGGLLLDYRMGYLDKLRSTPANRYAIIAGELVTLAIQSVVMGGIILVVTVLLGTPIASGLPGAILILVIAAAFGGAWAGTSMAPALLTKNEQATTTISFLFLPIAFMSTAFVPAAMMPDWLQTLNAYNPISHVIEAIRSLMIVGFVWEPIWQAIVSIVLLALVLHGLTLWAFRRLTA
jgi:ABC-2 type transport system permease protein